MRKNLRQRCRLRIDTQPHFFDHSLRGFATVMAPECPLCLSNVGSVSLTWSVTKKNIEVCAALEPFVPAPGEVERMRLRDWLNESKFSVKSFAKEVRVERAMVYRYFTGLYPG